MERALLVTVKVESERDPRSLEDMAVELEELVATCGADILDNVFYTAERPTPNFFIGRGKTEELAALAEELEAETLVFNRDLSGTQQRNLEEILSRKVIDRTQLILDIFARHAHSPEGKMQVELAQLEYLLPRLVGKGIMLSRLGGGIGTRGPGEQKLEFDRRQIRRRIDKLKSDLRDTASHRQTLRSKRKKKGIPSVALVGYTNAGKSTLLNALTDSNQTVSDSLFTTLDPLSKGLRLPNGEHAVISDTVGFLHGLPHHLIEAFKATLEEVVEADLLVHVLDISHPLAHDLYRDTQEVLKELKADTKPSITCLNKIDLLEDRSWLQKLKAEFDHSVAISAKTGENLQVLLCEIAQVFEERMVHTEVLLAHSRMDLLNLFYREAKVEEVKYLQKGIKVKLKLPKVLYHKLLHNKEIS